MQCYSLVPCSLQDTDLANETNAEVHMRPCSLQQSPAWMKKSASTLQIVHWQFTAYLLASQKLQSRHLPTACALFLLSPSFLLPLPTEEQACLSMEHFPHSPLLPPFSYRFGEILRYVRADPGLPAGIFLCQPLG